MSGNYEVRFEARLRRRVHDGVLMMILDLDDVGFIRDGRMTASAWRATLTRLRAIPFLLGLHDPESEPRVDIQWTAVDLGSSGGVPEKI